MTVYTCRWRAAAAATVRDDDDNKYTPDTATGHTLLCYK